MRKHKSGYWIGSFAQDQQQQTVFQLALDKLHQQELLRKSVLVRVALGHTLGFAANEELPDSQSAVLWQKWRRSSTGGNDHAVVDFYLNDDQAARLATAARELREQGYRARQGDQRLETAVIKQALKSYLATLSLVYPYADLLPPVPQVDWATLATRLREAREYLGCSQPILAEILSEKYGLNLKAPHISQIENQHRSKPRREVLTAIYAFFGWEQDF